MTNLFLNPRYEAPVTEWALYPGASSFPKPGVMKCGDRYGDGLYAAGPVDGTTSAASVVVPTPGKTYRARIRLGALVAGTSITARLILGRQSGSYVGSVTPAGAQVLATFTRAGGWYNGPAELVELTAEIPAGYVYNGPDAATANGLTLSVFGSAEFFTADPSLELVGADPDPDPEPEPEPDGALGALVAAYLGRTGDKSTTAQASVHAAIVSEYVRGYTRGKGFDEVTDEAVKPLQAVIVAATARLTANPEQVTYYASGDYSERPAVLAGWLLHELAILNRYRVRQA